MGLKSYSVHLKNKYPGASISRTESCVRAEKDGELLCIVEKDGQGVMRDGQKEHGARDPWSLDELPRNARVHKLHKDGSIGKDEEAASRAPIAERLCAKYGRVPSIEECKAQGLSVDREKNVILPAPQAAQAPAPLDI